MKIKIDKIKLLKRLVLLIILLTTIGFFIANKIVKKYGYNSVFDVITTYSKNSNLANTVTPIQLQINLSEANYEFIKSKRFEALNRGLLINEANAYVNCELKIDNNKVKAKLRLKGHMTDHLQGDKWSFRIKSKDTIMGMYRFSLQHPGTRNYVYEWIYHQLLKNENVIYLKYDFINVKINNKNLGIYAVEEHFGQHVLNRNKRPKGAIIRWNPNLYWEGRIDEYQRNYLNQEYANYTSSYPEPYDKSTVLNDKEIFANYKLAINKLEQFRRGELPTSKVFDVDKMAKFHAIIDLVGGQHSLDWSDVKFYYNSETKKIEPVGYESFSIRETESIAGQQLVNDYETIQFSYHAQLFADPIFYKAYIKNLERIATTQYVNTFYKKIEKELNQKIGIIAKEWPYRKFSFDGYYKNVHLIQHNLALPKAFHAFTKNNNSDSLTISLAAVSDFPIEIIGVKKKNKIIKTNHFILKPKARQSIINYVDITFYGNFSKIKNVVVLAKIPGSSHVFEIELAKYPAYKSKKNNFNLNTKVTIDTTIFSINKNTIFFKQKNPIINNKIIIPKTYNLVIYPNQNITLNNQLIVLGELNSHGLKNKEVNFVINTKGLLIINGLLKSSNTNFTGINCISSNKGNMSFYNCNFYDIKQNCFNINTTTLVLNNCNFANVNNAIHNNESKIKIINTNFKNGNMVLFCSGSYVLANKIKVENYQNLANLNYQSTLNIHHSTITKIPTVFELKNSSYIKSIADNYSNFDIAFSINPNSKKVLEKSTYNLFSPKLSNYKLVEKQI